VAALMVCLFHAGFLLTPFLPASSALLDIGQDGVYVFFVISGMVIPLALEKANYRIHHFFTFMCKRLLRLMPPLVASATLVALSSFIALHSNGEVLFKQWLASITLTAPLMGIPFVNEVFWTLYVEMQYYICIGLLFPMLHASNATRRRIMLLCLLAVSFLSLMSGGYEKSKLPFHLPVFLMGYITFLYHRKHIVKSEYLAWLVLSAGVCLFLVGYLHGFGYRIATVAALTSLLIAHVHRGNRWFSAMGEYSYSFYLMHWPVISALCFCAGTLTQTFAGALAVFLIVPIVSLGVARIFYAFSEKPALRWAKQLRYTP
jgi:peptidoglycan/LPS O-acetylase OafA/YrhL